MLARRGEMNAKACLTLWGGRRQHSKKRLGREETG